MASPNETAILRYLLQMGQGNRYRLARVMGISAQYAESMLGGLHRRGLLELGDPAPGSKCEVYKLTPDGADELLDVLGSLRQRELAKAERAALNVERLDKVTTRCRALMLRQGLVPEQAMEGAL